MAARLFAKLQANSKPLDTRLSTSLFDAADKALSKLSNGLTSKTKHKDLKTKTLECLTRLANIKADIRNHLRRQTSDTLSEDERLESALRDQCESSASDLYLPFQIAMGRMSSQRILLVTLEGLQQLARAGFFTIRIVQHSGEAVAFTSLPKNDEELSTGTSTSRFGVLADIAIHDLIENVAISDDTNVQLELIKTVESFMINPFGNACHGLTLAAALHFLARFASENRHPTVNKRASESLHAVIESFLSSMQEAFDMALTMPDENEAHLETSCSDILCVSPDSTAASPLRQQHSMNAKNLSQALERSPALVTAIQDTMQVVRGLTKLLARVVESEESLKAAKLAIDLLVNLLSKKGALIKSTSAFVEHLRNFLIKTLIKVTISPYNK